MSGTSQKQSVDQPFAPGELLVERFRVVRRVAQGGMGVVYEAYDEKLGRRIALKCARPGHGGHLSPEVRLATEVSHPNICKIYEIHTAQTAAGPLDFFTMEFLDGETLSRHIRERSLHREEKQTVARQICAGLAEAHRRQIIHGDLKSANILLTKNPDGSLRAVITDFGLACSSVGPGSPGGTPGYMAPELSDGGPTTVASDIYAFGAILHELVCGYLPHQRAAMLAATVTQLADGSSSNESSVAAGKNALPPLKSRWDPIITKCLQADPGQRYASVQQVLQALGPSAFRRRILIFAGAAAMAALAALATYQRSTAPAQTVRLDVAGMRSSPELASEASQLRDRALREIGGLKNSKEIAFSVHASRSTHRLSSDLAPKNGKIAVHAVLREVRSGAAVTEWSGDYQPAQLRYAPVALAGLVSSALHLPPPTTYARVNPAATASYQEGVALLQDDNKLDQAFAALQSAAALDPDSALPLAGLAEVARRRFFLTKVASWKQQAIAFEEQAELRNPDCAEVHRIAGLLEYDRSRPDQAIAREQRATEFQPPHPDAFRRLGQLYGKAGQTAQALQAYSEALRLAPQDARTYLDVANLYTSQSNFAEASRTLETAVRLAPDRPLFRTRLAGIYQDQGRFAEAEAELRIALKQEKSAETLVQLGHVLMYQKQDQQAIALLSEATDLQSAQTLGWFYLGLAHQRTGRVLEARRAFEKGLAAAGRDVIELPRNSVRRVVLARFCAQLGQADRAGLEAAQALQLAPENNDTVWLAALTYERMGNREAALKTLQSAPRPLLEDLQRWPEASSLTADDRFTVLLRPRR